MNFHLAFDKTTLQFTIHSISFLVMFQPAVSQGELTNQVCTF